MSRTLRGKLSPEDCRPSYGRLREQEEDGLHQNNIDENNSERGDDNAVRGSAPNAFSAFIGGVAEVRGDQANDGSENNRLEGWRNKGCPAHVVKRPGNVESDGQIRGRAFR